MGTPVKDANRARTIYMALFGIYWPPSWCLAPFEEGQEGRRRTKRANGPTVKDGPLPDPCAILRCPMIGSPIETCRDHRCPHRWQREGKERRERDRQRDEREKNKR